jgi:hypothetical protein
MRDLLLNPPNRVGRIGNQVGRTDSAGRSVLSWKYPLPQSPTNPWLTELNGIHVFWDLICRQLISIHHLRSDNTNDISYVDACQKITELNPSSDLLFSSPKSVTAGRCRCRFWNEISKDRPILRERCRAIQRSRVQVECWTSCTNRIPHSFIDEDSSNDAQGTIARTPLPLLSHGSQGTEGRGVANQHIQRRTRVINH